MKLQDARTISATELYDRRKQAILLYKKGNMTQIEIGEVVGVGRNVICEWVKKWKLGGLKALKPACSGRPVGTGRTLNSSQERELQKCLIEKNPEQYKMDFALWTRSAVQGLIKELYAIEMPIRTDCGPLPQAVGLYSTKTSEARLRAKRQESERMDG